MAFDKITDRNPFFKLSILLLRIVVNQVESDLQKWTLDLILRWTLSHPITYIVYLQRGRNWMAIRIKMENLSSLFCSNPDHKLAHFFIFAVKIRVILQKVNEMTLEICSCTLWIRIVKGSRHEYMNSITLGKFKDSIWAVVTEFSWTTHIIMSMVNFNRAIEINKNIALNLTIN